MEKERIQRVLAASGVASRRGVEEMILHGRIAVNGQVVTKLPCFVEPGDEIVVDGQVVRKRPQRLVYMLLNKPRGVVSSTRDDSKSNRPTVLDVIPAMAERVYSLGQLDEDTTGLVILTNDGELTNLLTHPRRDIEKTYIAHLDGRLGAEDLDRLRGGAFVDGRRCRGPEATLVRSSVQESVLKLTMTGGSTRIMRRVLANMGFKVRRLHRLSYGPLSDRGLKIGSWRNLTDKELGALRKAAGGTIASTGGAAPAAGRRVGSRGRTAGRRR